ncbi:MAG: hypothetical protein HYU58_08750 [Proteobacteria bacterium]|nr:hypothetical protein [Pseudomonadota bacterium]
MTENYRPTYISDKKNVYSAGQVRLYGIPGLSSSIPAGAADGIGARIAAAGISDDIAVAVIDRKGDERLRGDVLNDNLKKAFASEIKESDASFVVLESVIKGYMILLGALNSLADSSDPVSAGVIFGYAFEGHTYDLAKPKIMLIPAMPDLVPQDDSGYDKKPGYRVWIVDKLNQCVELEMSQGYVEQIVLEANLPGRRSPTMYAGRMQLGHRGGRLNE